MNVLVQGNRMPYATAFQTAGCRLSAILSMLAENFPVARFVRICRSACIIMTPLKKKWVAVCCKKITILGYIYPANP